MPQSILVVIGNDPALKVDLSAFRAVRQQTGLNFTRISPTWAEFRAHLRRLRMQDEMPYLHMAMHMAPDGAQFKDKLVSPEELSEVVSGVPILFLAGCESTSIGDLLGNVPAVVTLLEVVEHDSARSMAELFWTAIGQGYEAQAAYDMALERLPDVAEFAYLHVHTPFLAQRKGVN